MDLEQLLDEDDLCDVAVFARMVLTGIMSTAAMVDEVNTCITNKKVAVFTVPHSKVFTPNDQG